MTIFWNSCTRNFGKFPGKHLQFPFNEITQLQWTAYYWTKTLVTDISLEVLRRRRMFLNFKNSKKLFQNCFFFCDATGMQSRISGFNKTDYTKKSFLLVFWNSSKYLRKDLQWSHFIKVTRLLFKSLTVIKKH